MISFNREESIEMNISNSVWRSLEIPFILCYFSSEDYFWWPREEIDAHVLERICRHCVHLAFKFSCEQHCSMM
jgi:hypothetical protein